MTDPKKRDLTTTVSVERETQNWVKKLYDPNNFSDTDLLRVYELVKYVGFDRNEMLSKLAEKLGDTKTAAEAVLVCSLRGPRKAEGIKLSNGKTLRQMGVPASDQKGTQNLSCQRISAATADLAAFFLKKLRVPKRVESDLPAWLQFPTAGSIVLPPKYRTLHKEFAKKFSTLIGGEFNESIYMQMEGNAYLDSRLHLFDESD